MLLVVFGAGASYDSSPDRAPGSEDIRPPLANELFELRPIHANAAQDLPKCQLIIDQLRHIEGDSTVEQELEKLRDGAKDYPEGKRQLASIQFYLQQIISKTQGEWNRFIYRQTNYRTLLGQIDRYRKGEPVCFVTFNYDTLLEEAFVSLGPSFSSLDDYVSGDYRVIKLHGSVNWAHEIASPMEIHESDPMHVANSTIAQADKIELSDRFHLATDEFHRLGMVSYLEKISGKNGRQAVFPAIAIPFEKKTEQAFECPSEHVKVLEDCISKTDKLIIIGWKVAEEKFVDLLTKKLPEDIFRMVVSRDKQSASMVLDKLPEFKSSGENWLAEKGFTDELRTRRIEAFLAGRSERLSLLHVG